jgi:hypothetical protein
MSDPSLCTNLPPAPRTKRLCISNKAWRQVVGVSLGSVLAFFKGENSSSL